ncbi:MAG: hypothetical protein ACE5IL_17340, partial [Myxococcota bacterium]
LDAPRNDQGLARCKLDLPRRLPILEDDADPARDEEQELITIRVHLASVGRLTSQERRSDRVAIEPGRRARRALEHTRLPLAIEADHRGA